jgi:hypothetical protein
MGREPSPPDSLEENGDESSDRNGDNGDYSGRNDQMSLWDRANPIVTTAGAVAALLVIADAMFKNTLFRSEGEFETIIAFASTLIIVGMPIGLMIIAESGIHNSKDGNSGPGAQQNRWFAKLIAGGAASTVIGVILIILSTGWNIRVSPNTINNPTPYDIAKLLVVLLGFVALYLLSYYEISKYVQIE